MNVGDLGIHDQLSDPEFGHVAPYTLRTTHCMQPAHDGKAADVYTLAQASLLEVLTLAERGLGRLMSHSEHWESDGDPYRSTTEKILVETALLALLASRVVDAAPAINASLERLVAQLDPLVRTTEKAALLVKHPHVALPFGIAHVALEKLGRPDSNFSSMLREALASGHVDSIERLPYRRLEIAWLRALWDDVPLDYNPHREGSIGRTLPHPLHMSVPDVYALTHTLLYLTDFGRFDLPAEINTPTLRQCLDACLVWQLFEENVDTVGELLMSAMLLTTPLSTAAWTCWDAINALWAKFGFLPGPSLNAQQYDALTGTQRNAYVFQHSYHTMYVLGILDAMVLLRGFCAPPAPGYDADESRYGVPSRHGPIGCS